MHQKSRNKPSLLSPWRAAVFASCGLLCAQLSAAASLLSAGVNLGAAGPGEDWAIFALSDWESGATGSTVTGSASVEGNIAVAGTGNLFLAGNGRINGDFFLSSLGTLTQIGDAKISGNTITNPVTDAALKQGVADARMASNNAFALTPSVGYPTTINTNESLTLSGTGTVVLQLSDFKLRGNAALTLEGDAATTFVINVRDDFSMRGKTKVQLSGGLTWDNVLFNIRGEGSASLSGNAELNGIILAKKRTLELNGSSQVLGEVIASNVLLSGASVVSLPPIVSP